MYKTYLFDCGNVLIGFSREHLMDVYVGSDKTDRDLVWNALFPNWHLQDEGLPSKDYFEQVKKVLPERLWQSAYNVIFHWKEEVWPIPGMVDLLKELKEDGKQLILLSNMPDTFSYHHEGIEALEYFDELVFSFIVGLAKPYKEIYEYAIKKYNINPSECLFVDDGIKNIATAKELGINTYLFNPEHPEEFIEFVKKNK